MNRKKQAEKKENWTNSFTTKWLHNVVPSPSQLNSQKMWLSGCVVFCPGCLTLSEAGPKIGNLYKLVSPKSKGGASGSQAGFPEGFAHLNEFD